MAGPAEPRRVRGEAVAFSDFPNHETIWAIAAGPGPLIQVAVCCENTGGGTVQLYSYDTRSRTMHRVLDAALAIGEDPADGHASHGKVHFSLCPASDGWVYAATHCTTPPLGDDIWDARKMWNHPRKSFSGGHVFRYRPDTGECEDFGIPFPNQGIPALVFDETMGRLAGLTFPGARLFVMDRDGTGFEDLGRVSADYPLCLALDGQGCAWTSDTYGYVIRVDLGARCFDLLPSRLPAPRGAVGMAANMSDTVAGPDGFMYCVTYNLPNLFRFRPVPEGPVDIEDLGPFLPGSSTRVTRGLVFGPDRSLYACAYSPYDPADRPRLGRFDPETAQGTEIGSLDMGGVPRRYWRAALGADGRIYAGECGRRPVSLLIFDPADPDLATEAPADTPAEYVGEQVDIVSVHGLRTRESAVAMQEFMAIYDDTVRAGCVYGLGLAWPPPALLPLTDAAVTALGVAPQGEVWAATSGVQAHLVWMPKPLQATHAGAIPGCRRVAPDLVFGPDGTLYGASRDKGGALFSCDAAAGVFFKYIDAPSAIHILGQVFEDDGVACLAISADGAVLAGIGDQTGSPFLYRIDTSECRVIDLPGDDGRLSPLIAAAPDGGFYGTRPSGEIVRLSCEGEISAVGTLPCAAASLCLTRAGRIAAGTTEGGLVFLNPASGKVVDCGRPARMPRLASIVEARDGRLFGITGGEDDLSHLVSYDPDNDRWEDLELLACHGEFPWTAYRIGPLAVGVRGEIIAGEEDRFGHLFIYHPS